MNLLRSALAGAVVLAAAAPAMALDFTMDFDNIPVAVPPPDPPDQELGSAVLGYYNNDPVYQRDGRKPWNIVFSEQALAICYGGAGDDCPGQFPKPPSGNSAVGTVTADFFEFSVTPGLYVQKLSFEYTDAGQGSFPSVILYANGTQLGTPLTLTPCIGAFCEWKSYTVSGEDLARGQVTAVRFLGTPNSVVFDNIALTTAPVPEPSTYALLLGGLALVVGAARRQRR